MPLYSIAGSQGTGKSTTLGALEGFNVVSRKTSRSILTDWDVTLDQVNNDNDLTVAFQEEILKRKIADEQEAVESKELWLTERTFADLFTYAVVSVGKNNQWSTWLDGYYERCKKAQETYSMVFYLSAGHFVPVHDGVRGSNQHYSHMVDLTMYSFTRKMCSDETLVTINTPDLNQRVKTIKDYVRFDINHRPK